MTTVGIRELKNHLSRYLRLVREGETVQVTDRGQVVAELKPPAPEPADFPYPELLRLARDGRVRLGTGNHPDLYGPAPFQVPPGTAARVLDDERGER